MPTLDLTVDRLDLELRAAAAPSRAETIERRIHDAMTGRLERALAHRMATYAGAELVFIDVLELAACANTAWDDDRIVEEMAHRFDAAVAGALRSTAEHGRPGIRRFRDHAEWDAAYLLARIEGTADDRWWFSDFDGLRPLPLSSTIRTVIEVEGDAGIDALLCLAPTSLVQVISALCAVDASRVLAIWTQRTARTRVPIVDLWTAAQQRRSRPPHDFVHACVELERRDRGAIGPRTVTLLAALAAVMRALTGQRTAAASAEPTPEALSQWCVTLGIDPGWVPLLDSDEIAQLTLLIRESSGGYASWDTRADARVATNQSTFARTSHGGVFVLAVVASWLEWPARWQRQFARRRATRDDAESLSRSLLLAVCAHASSSQPDAVVADPGIAAAFGVNDCERLLATHAQPAQTALRGAARRDPSLAGAARVLLAALAERVPGCCGSSVEYLRRNLLEVGAGIAVEGDGLVRITLARAPLHVLLLLAGLTRATFGCCGRRIVLATEEGA